MTIQRVEPEPSACIMVTRGRGSLKIESDGTSEGTIISVRGSGEEWEPIKGCQSFTFSVSVDRRIATITIANPIVILTGDLAESAEVPS